MSTLLCMHAGGPHEHYVRQKYLIALRKPQTWPEKRTELTEQSLCMYEIYAFKCKWEKYAVYWHFSNCFLMWTYVRSRLIHQSELDNLWSKIGYSSIAKSIRRSAKLKTNLDEAKQLKRNDARFANAMQRKANFISVQLISTLLKWIRTMPFKWKAWKKKNARPKTRKPFQRHTARKKNTRKLKMVNNEKLLAFYSALFSFLFFFHLEIGWGENFAFYKLICRIVE